ncbi:hypothetical protein CASFOL_002756 [Castilleja foliolosa]|uniref:Uncharacterized protein n=1 Tax=Castilleja foliolosa TaxID=1961234 RepID=A0ABD3EFL0_9LAMI
MGLSYIGLSRRLRGQVLRCHPRLGQIRLSLEPQERSCNALSPLILKYEIHEIELEVRDYKLDQYDLHDGVARAGDVLALTDLSLKFIASLRSGDRFILKKEEAKEGRVLGFGLAERGSADYLRGSNDKRQRQRWWL